MDEEKNTESTEGKEDEEGKEDIAERMDEDLDLGNEIKDNVVPLALELYLGIVDLGDSDEEGEEVDSDGDDAPKPKGKGGKKGKEDCK